MCIPVYVKGTRCGVQNYYYSVNPYHHRCLPLLCVLFTIPPPPPRLISSDLPDTEASKEGIREAHEIIKETHQKMARQYRAVTNRERKNQKVEAGTLVWLRVGVIL